MLLIYRFVQIHTKTLFPVDALILNAYEHDNQVTQELRLASPVDKPLTWIVGLYYLHNYKDRPVDAFQEYLPGSAFAHKAAGFPPPILYQNVQVAHTTSAAPFADVAYNLTDRLKLDVGGRYTWQDKSGSAYLNSTGGNDDRWELSFWGKNITNLHYAVYAQSAEVYIATGSEFNDPTKYLYEIQPGPYRSFGVTLRTRF